MAFREQISLDGLRPSTLWRALDDDTRRLAARSVYARGWDDGSGRREADTAVAEAIRFRPLMLRRMPVERRVDHLLRRVSADDGLATTLLLALHLVQRRSMLCVFLDALGIDHEDGVIRGDQVEPPAADRLEAAVRRLYEEFPAEHVDVYLRTLIAMDDEPWAGLRPIVRARPPG